MPRVKQKRKGSNDLSSPPLRASSCNSVLGLGLGDRAGSGLDCEGRAVNRFDGVLVLAVVVIFVVVEVWK